MPLTILPMLYRARRAVIIGDPKQLSHISTISKTQDLNLVQKYGVEMGWAYSATSLYAKGSSIANPDQIISLRDHHRSFGDIIEFSNAEFRIRPCFFSGAGFMIIRQPGRIPKESRICPPRERPPISKTDPPKSLSINSMISDTFSSMEVNDRSLPACPSRIGRMT